MSYNKFLNIVSKHYLVDEDIYLYEILKSCNFENKLFKEVKRIALDLTIESRKNIRMNNLENMLTKYNLSTKEGVQIMCLAESLVRIPDFITGDSLIKDKISFQEWDKYYRSEYWKLIFYNFVIDILSKIYYQKYNYNKEKFLKIFKKIIFKFSSYVMKNIGKNFVFKNNAESAAKNSFNNENLLSFDMLGEAALTFYDARKYFNQYHLIIKEIKKYFSKKYESLAPSVSIKLSALNPKYSFMNRKKLYRDLIPLLNILLIEAKEGMVELTIDAEECDRLELSLSIYNKLFHSEICDNWDQFGLVVQAYSKRTLPILYWLKKIANCTKKKIPVRLVKGAYWDYEIKISQILNLIAYPVYIRKFCTDLSYLLCTVYLLNKKTLKSLTPQFATHNIQTISFVLALCGSYKVELQKLYGMGNEVYKILKKSYDVKIREYAPIGKYKELLPYLVRRLLENGANSSFVNKITETKIKLGKLIRNPIFFKYFKKYINKIPLPIDLFAGKRNVVRFYNLNIAFHHYIFIKKILYYKKKIWIANSFNNSNKIIKIVVQPSNIYKIVGITKQDLSINYYINLLKSSFNSWNNINIHKKIKIIKNFIILLKDNFIELICLCAKEAGKTLTDCISDIKEALDFCKYYCNQAFIINKFAELPSTTGENNIYYLQGKGVMSTISPWNFPIAIFCGQLIATLLSGNVVLAKPAETTTLIAYKLITMLYKAGIPFGVCQLIIGSGSSLGNLISMNREIKGIVFTGSNEVANIISNNLLMRPKRPLFKLIAETGGINVMIADSSALVEQVVFDILESSFKSCGQRCSALRLIYLNEEIYLETLELLMKSLSSISINDSIEIDTDIGPLISKKSMLNLTKYLKKVKHFFNNEESINENGYFFKPTLVRVVGIHSLNSEQFGPILHIALYKTQQINFIINEINNAEFGLTFGIHSRNESFYKFLSNEIKVGNVYVNRNTIGAIVGMQPFGGCNFSGTGPKAGGPNYLTALINEKTITINTTAQGGNVELLNI